MLPYFRRLPQWVRWIAQDADGVWWAYEHEPNMSASGWYENEVGQRIKLKADEPNPSWREEIYSIKIGKQ